MDILRQAGALGSRRVLVTARFAIADRMRALSASSLVVGMSMAWAAALTIVAWVISTEAPDNVLLR